MDAWMNSPGHRANILNCDYTTLGIGIHFGTGGPGGPRTSASEPSAAAGTPAGSRESAALRAAPTGPAAPAGGQRVPGGRRGATVRSPV